MNQNQSPSFTATHSPLVWNSSPSSLARSSSSSSKLMDHSWRPPRQPPVAGPICPICSISHIPFCPPPPPLMENPRFHYSQPQIDYYLPFTHNHNHPFPNHQSSLHANYYCNPSDGPYGGDPRGDGKRMRFDDNNRARARARTRGGPSESERILKLIHDHGNAAAAAAAVSDGNNNQTSTPTQPLNSLSRTNFNLDPPSLFPVALTSSSLASAVVENHSSPVYYTPQGFHILQSSSDKHAPDIQPTHKIDASHIFKHPHRASRPDHFVIILRGLPGSGKSYLAKLLRDIEVENGGEAPRIHSMDDYFMIEVEKAEDSELPNSSGSFRGKRRVMKTVMEYCYEAEMEEAYRASMLKAFKKTLDEGVYSFVIVDDRNLRVADFAQFWATAKRSGYEVYLVEASYKDPVGCAARNVHNFTLSDVQKMARQWEEAPSLYLRMDIKSLLHGEGFVESGIQEVDMDMEDEDRDDFRAHGIETAKLEEVKDLRRSKWSNDLDEEEGGGGKLRNSGGSLSGLVQAYSSKETKSVCWGDQGGNVGFSITAAKKKTNTRSLVIGPGPGYNLRSNPLSEDEHLKAARNDNNQNVFQQRIRAERESFKAVFDKRRQRIAGFSVHDDDDE